MDDKLIKQFILSLESKNIDSSIMKDDNFNNEQKFVLFRALIKSHSIENIANSDLSANEMEDILDNEISMIKQLQQHNNINPDLYSLKQLYELNSALNQGLNIEPYKNPEFSADQMYVAKTFQQYHPQFSLSGLDRLDPDMSVKDMLEIRNESIKNNSYDVSMLNRVSNKDSTNSMTKDEREYLNFMESIDPESFSLDKAQQALSNFREDQNVRDEYYKFFEETKIDLIDGFSERQYALDIGIPASKIEGYDDGQVQLIREAIQHMKVDPTPYITPQSSPEEIIAVDYILQNGLDPRNFDKSHRNEIGKLATYDTDAAIKVINLEISVDSIKNINTILNNYGESADLKQLIDELSMPIPDGIKTYTDEKLEELSIDKSQSIGVPQANNNLSILQSSGEKLENLTYLHDDDIVKGWLIEKPDLIKPENAHLIKEYYFMEYGINTTKNDIVRLEQSQDYIEGKRDALQLHKFKTEHLKRVEDKLKNFIDSGSLDKINETFKLDNEQLLDRSDLDYKDMTAPLDRHRLIEPKNLLQLVSNANHYARELSLVQQNSLTAELSKPNHDVDRELKEMLKFGAEGVNVDTHKISELIDSVSEVKAIALPDGNVMLNQTAKSAISNFIGLEESRNEVVTGWKQTTDNQMRNDLSAKASVLLTEIQKTAEQNKSKFADSLPITLSLKEQAAFKQNPNNLQKINDQLTNKGANVISMNDYKQVMDKMSSRAQSQQLSQSQSVSKGVKR